jgi:hypothetical protein
VTRRVRSFSLLLLPVLAAVAACESDQEPTVEAGGEQTTEAAQASTTTTSGDTSSTIDAAEVQTLELALTGDVEVPPPGSTGTAEATLTYDGDELCVEGTTTGVGALIGGHIHAAPAGESGDIVIDLGITTAGDGPFEGCATVGAEGGVVLEDPTNYYLNLHTAEFPTGAVRAQLG